LGPIIEPEGSCGFTHFYPVRGKIRAVTDNSSSRIPIVVISDGKPGHENQSLGIAEHIPGSDILLIRHNLELGLKESIFRAKLRMLPVTGNNAPNLLKTALSEEEINSFVNFKPAAIIAAGTLSAGLCHIAGKLTGAKTCICMVPSLLPLSIYDLAVVPAHDNPPDAPNILVTLAAPNRVSDEMLSDEADRWWDELPQGEKIISWVIGGPSASAEFDQKHVLGGLLETLMWARYNNRQVWLSTARRTPESLEETIDNIREGYPSLKWHLLWHRDKRNPLYAMFYRSEVAIVTSDSVSMIAEAASAGVGPIVYRASQSTGTGSKPSKQERMVEGLMREGYGMRVGSPDELTGILEARKDENARFNKLDDTAKAAERLSELIRKNK